MSRYWLDADVFIQAKNTWYGFEIAPPFWGWLEELANVEIIGSPMMVRDELIVGNDDLATWVKSSASNSLFINSDKSVQEAITQIVDHIKLTYAPAKHIAFLNGADPWVIAHAKADNGAVVAHEARKDRTCQRPKVPNICDHFGVPCLTLWDFLKLVGKQFK